jgi:hypothetical protein
MKKLKLCKVLESVSGDVCKCVPIEHAVTGKQLSLGSFTNFLLHSLLQANITNHKPATTKPKDSIDEGNHIPGYDFDALAGPDLRDSCSYLIAALASRPGLSVIFVR